MARHRSFSFEFKRQVAEDFLEGRAGMHELARRYSLSRNLIRLWIQKYEAGELTDEVVGAVRIAEYENKIAELERKVGQLTMEVDLLKKGAQLGRRVWERVPRQASVRSASLVERRGFELPVLFGSFAPGRPLEIHLFSAKRLKRDRQFESPPLHQRGTANRKPDPSMTIDRERSHRLSMLQLVEELARYCAAINFYQRTLAPAALLVDGARH